MKIAIFSGVIPSTTFIEHLISNIAKTHEVLLFGAILKTQTYHSKRIKVYGTSLSVFKRLSVTCFRLLKLTFRYPNRLSILLSEVKKQQSFYQKRATLRRILPVILTKPDVFHIQWAKDLDQWMFLREKLDVKLVLSLRGAHINYSPIADEQLASSFKDNFPKVDAFHAVSKAIAKEAQKYNASQSKVTVIHSSLKPEIFSYYSPYKKTTSQDIAICAVGRFHWIKGYKYLIDACGILKDQDVNFHLTIVSSNPISEAILFQIHQLKLQDHITIIQNLPQSELFPVMKSNDVLVLPSLKEGIANVVLEAMAIGVPVISTDCGGMSEVVKPSINGWLVPVRDAVAIANGVVELSQTSEDQLKTMTEHAHKFVKQHFNNLDSIQQFEQLYESVFR